MNQQEKKKLAAGKAVQEKTIATKGMDCPDCARKLAERLGKLENIEEALTSFSTGNIYLRYHGDLTDVYKILTEEGIHVAGTKDEEEKRFNFFRSYVFWSGVLLILAIPAGLAGTALRSLLLLSAVAMGGHAPFRRGMTALWRRRIDMNVLMTVAVSGALLIGEWWEAATVTFLFAVGNSLESYTAGKNRTAIRSLFDKIPTSAHLLTHEGPVTVTADQVKAGEKILVRPGEKIPLDGIIIEGNSQVTQAAITGEPLPIDKKIGDKVFAGTINGSGSLQIKATGTSKETVLARISRHVEQAQLKKAPVERFIDDFARYYTPAVIILAATLILAGPVITGDPWQSWLYRGLALLIVACPCALVVSTPVSLAAALVSAARQGVLVKGGEFIEQAYRVKTYIFDKTGTLTAGRPEVREAVPLAGKEKKEIILLAASLEGHADHPLAEAVRDYAKANNIKPLPIGAFKSYPGKGVAGKIEGQDYALGNAALLADWCIAPIETGLKKTGDSELYLINDKQVLGVFLVNDFLRVESREVVQKLRNEGIKNIFMLTGDTAETAQAIAEAAALDGYRAELLPEDKEQLVNEYRDRYGKVAMVGDGINDAPALAAADVGIAMGRIGSDTALETAGVVLLNDDLQRLVYLTRLSRQTMNIVRQNVIISLTVKAVAIALVFPGLLTLWLAILADVGASLLVTVNGMRLLYYKEKAGLLDTVKRM